MRQTRSIHYHSSSSLLLNHINQHHPSASSDPAFPLGLIISIGAPAQNVTLAQLSLLHVLGWHILAYSSLGTTD